MVGECEIGLTASLNNSILQLFDFGI